MNNAPSNVCITSTIAILKMRYEWTPFPGSPNYTNSYIVDK